MTASSTSPAKGARRVVNTSPEEPPPPMHLEDLPHSDDLIGQPTHAVIRQLHAAAVEAGRDMYVDPANGLYVFTSTALKRRPCCGKKCRHCPWGHKNVPKPKDHQQQQLEEDPGQACCGSGDGGGTWPDW